MFLNDILIENVGPISKISLPMPFNSNGTPKPIVLVGENGTGKSIILSYITDALVEFAANTFEDVVIGQTPTYRNYFRTISAGNQKLGAKYGIALLQFKSFENSMLYVDKTGTLDHATYLAALEDRFTGALWKNEENHKNTIGFNKQVIQNSFERGSFCYFPPNRRERPHWLNSASLPEETMLVDIQKFTGKLGKPIYIESCALQNKAWLIRVLADSRTEVAIDHSTTPLRFNLPFPQNAVSALTFRQSAENINVILRLILKNNLAQLRLNHRSDPISSISIINSHGQTLIPSLDHLSTGQATLFNLFITIIRYADIRDPQKSIRLDEIEGIVLIDEIDAHLHGTLQHNILPRLIQQFPKIQFIVTSHSPLFLLGMQEKFGNDGFVIIDMPNGNRIGAERFTEFRHSFEYYMQTEIFEQAVQETIQASTKPVVFLEGKTDESYIRTALTLFNRGDILDKLDIRWIGNVRNGKEFNTGKSALDQAKNMIEANPDLFNHKVMLIYDCDANKGNANYSSFVVQTLSKNPHNAKVTKGIENLLPENCFDGSVYLEGQDAFRRRFYPSKMKTTEYGEVKQNEEFDKDEFCKWICEERKEIDDFQAFCEIIKVLDSFSVACKL